MEGCDLFDENRQTYGNNWNNDFNSWKEIEQLNFLGWDFSEIDGLIEYEELAWDYKNIVKQYIKPQHKLLDMGTGGGEFLLTLNHPHENTCVTEAWVPNVQLCNERLAPLGITVKQVFDDNVLPYDDNTFDIIINRHEAFSVKEIRRILKPGGVFITQQIGGKNNEWLSKYMDIDFKANFPNHSLGNNVAELEDNGFDVLYEQESYPYIRFNDVKAIVYYAKNIPWEFKEFSVERCFNRLLELKNIIMKNGYVESLGHRFIIVSKCVK